MFNLADHLEAKRALVDTSLEEHLPGTATRPALLHEAMRYSMLVGGKRLRPILCLAACETVGGREQDARWPALALELLHTYTLVHDDLPCMDDDDLRRGQPTCHKKFGEANAVLAGDALLTLAFEWLARTPGNERFSAADYVTELAAGGGHGGVIAGQVEDLAAESNHPTAEDVDFIHRNKTAALIRTSLRLGAMAGAATDEQLEALSLYGERIGLAFQIADDLLNATSTAEQLGKAVGSDEARGKTTYIAVYGEEEARKHGDQLVEDAVDALSVFEERPSVLYELARHIVERTH